MKFKAKLALEGKTATGIEVPEKVLTSLGGKRVPVEVTINGYSYRTTIGVMGGRFLIPVSAEHRKGAGVAAGDALTVEVERDTAERTVELPPELVKIFKTDKVAKAAFESLAFSHRKEHVRSIEDAKKPETRARRVAATLDALRAKN